MQVNSLKILCGGTLLDGTSAAPLLNPVIIIKEDKIAAVMTEEAFLTPREPFILFDTSGKTILPGLIDAHTHVQYSGDQSEADMLQELLPFKVLRAAFHARMTLESGFTSIRDLGAELLVDVAMRDAINEGLVPGPRMLVSGYKITSTGSDFPLYPPEMYIAGRQTMDSPYEARKAARTLLASGVDLIKVMASGRTFRKASSPDAAALTLEEMRAAVWEARNQGKKIAAHAHGSKGVKLALEAGCDSIEHGTVLDDEDIERMLDQGVFLVPTLSYGKHLEQMGLACNLPDYAFQKALASRKRRLQSFARALARGVRIALGSDSGMPFVLHGDNAFELWAMVEAGMLPSQAIIAATSAAAALMGIADEAGSISPGKVADIIVVDGNPIADISILQDKNNITAVFKGGSIVVDRGLQLKHVHELQVD